MSKWDVFYSEYIGLKEIWQASQAVTTGGTLTSAGVELVVGSNTNFLAGTYVTVTEAAKTTAYCVVVGNMSSNRIHLVQVPGSSTDAIGVAYTTSATVATYRVPIARLRIDLSDVPPDVSSYKYLILGAATISRDSSGGCALFITGSSDPFREIAGAMYQEMALHSNAASNFEDKELFNSVFSDTVAAGGSEEYVVWADALSSGIKCRIDSVHLIAYRVDTSLGMFLEDKTGLSTQTAVTCTGVASGSYQDVATISSANITTQDYFIASAATLSCNQTGDLIVGFIMRGATEYANPRLYVHSTADKYSFGYFGRSTTPTSSADVKLRISNTGNAGTISCTSYYLAIFNIAAIPALSSTYLTKTTTGDQTTVTSQYWSESDKTTSQITGQGMCTEVVCSDIRSGTSHTSKFRARIRSTAGPDVFQTHRGNDWGGSHRLQGFFFRRYKRNIQESIVVAVDIADSSATSASIVCRNTSFSILPENTDPDYVTPIDAYKTVVAHIESGLLLKNWLPEGNTDVYKKYLEDVPEVSRVLRNSVEVTLATTSPTWSGASADTAYWDSSTKTIYIKMPSGKQPSDRDQTVLVMHLIRVARNALDLQSETSASTYYRYLGRAKSIPGVTTNLDVRGSGAQTSLTVGNLDLITADGYFKDLIGQRIWEGLRARVLVGYDKIRPNIGAFKTVLNAILAMPQQSGDVFRLRLLDRSAVLRKPLSTSSITTFVGGNSTSAFSYQEKIVLPLVFGELVRRIPAYRVSNFLSAGSVNNYYKYAANPCKSVSACYSDDTTEKKIAFTDEDPANGIVKVDNSIITGYDASNRLAPDMVYVDVVGETDTGLVGGTALRYPGEIAYAVLTRYPYNIDSSFGTAFAIAGGGFTLSDSGSMSVTVTTGTATWQYGDRLVAIDGAKTAHLQVINKTSNTVYTMIPLHEPGDSSDGTVFSTSGTIKECVVAANGLAAKDTIYSTFRNMDSGRWRSQMQNGVLQLQSPKVNLVVTSGMSVADAMNEICRISFMYWYINRIGRIGVGLPDEDFGNLLLNPGFEWDPDGEWYWPWSLENGATASLTSKAYEGYRSIQVSNQSSLTSRLSQDVVFDRPGKYVATAMVSLQSGSGGGCRLMIIPPGKDRGFVSDSVVITSSKWQRISLKFEIKPGMLGTGRFVVIPYAPMAVSNTDPQYSSHILGNFGGESIYGWYSDGDEVPTLIGLSGTTLYDVSSVTKSLIVFEESPINPYRSTLRISDNANSSGTSYAGGVSLSATNGFTVSVIWCWDGRTEQVERVVWGVSAKNFKVGIMVNGGSYGINFYDGVGYGSVFTVPTYGRTYLVTVTHITVAGTITTNLYINGTLTSTRSSASAVNNGGLFEIRGGGGWLGQILIYDEVLSATNRPIVESYLQDRWGCTATSINVDNCGVFKVSAFCDDTNTDFGNVEFSDEIYPEVRVTYNINTSQPQFSGAQIATDSESQLLIKSVSEGKNAIQTSQRLDIAGANVRDAASASGIAAAAAGYFGRQKQILTGLTLLGQDEIPDIGDKIYVDMTQAPVTLDDSHLWRVTRVDYSGDNVHTITVDAERQIDNVTDRSDISPTEVPLGAIVLTNVVDATFGASHGDGFYEMTSMQGYYVLGSPTVDVVTANGASTHTHTFNHYHSVAAHSHTFSLGTLNYVSGYGSSMNRSIGPFVAASANNHTHANASSGHTTQSSSAAMSTSTTSINSNLGPNDPKSYRVRFMKRTGTLGSFFSTDMIVGYLFNAVPSGWSRVTAMDGYYLRGATTFTGVSTTVGAGGYTKSDTSTSMVVASTTGMSTGQVLVLNSNIHVVVDSVVDATHVMIRALNWTSDASSASSGNTVTSASEAVATTYTPTGHDHTGAIASHTHTFAHSHLYPNATIAISGTPSATDTAYSTAYGTQISTDVHTHSLSVSSNYTLTDVVTSGSATGSAVSSVVPVPDVLKIAWMKPASGSVSEFPSGAIIFWDGTVCPTGYTRLGSADNLLIGSADAGADAAASGGGHAHTFTASSHSGTHVHSNCSAIVPASPNYLGMAAGSYNQGATIDHYHTSTASSFSSVNPSIPAITGLTSSTSSGTSNLPFHKKLLLCKKD